MNRIKNTYRHLLFVTVLCSVGFVDHLLAAGTPAGTVIQSRSQAIYSTASGAKVDTVYSGIVSITVKQVGAFNVSPSTNGIVTNSDSTVADFPITVTNSGNGTDLARLSAVSSRGWITQMYFDANGDGQLQASEVNAGTITQTTSLAADVSFNIVLRVRIPRGENLDQQQDTTVVLATSNFDSTRIVEGRYLTTVRTPRLFANVGLSVSNLTPSPGSQITYTYTYTNNGSVPANGLTITNLIPGTLTFMSGTTSQGTFNAAGNPVVWTIGTIAPGASLTITLTVRVNANVLPGTVIANPFTVQYTVGSNNYIISTNPAEITVGGVLQPGVEITAMWNTLTKEASDTAVYRFKVRNSGTVKDVIEIDTTSTQNFPWTVFRDGNNNGQLDGTDPQLTNSNGLKGIDVDSVAAGDSVRLFARAIVPRKRNQVRDSLIVTGSVASDQNIKSSAVVTTTVNAPDVTISLNVFPVGDLPAGSVVTYTISFENKGSASVNNFSIIDQTPIATQYIPNSVKVNGAGVADNTGPLSIIDQGETKIISVVLGTLNATQKGSVEFKVKIK